MLAAVRRVREARVAVRVGNGRKKGFDMAGSIFVGGGGEGYSTPQIGRWLGLHHTSILAAAKLPAAKPGVVSRHPTAEPVEVPYPDLSGEWAI